jgi:hypothetical protein
LHLTNIKFCQDEETDGVYIEDEYPLEVVSNLLALDQEMLCSGLISTYSITAGNLTLKNYYLEIFAFLKYYKKMKESE